MGLVKCKDCGKQVSAIDGKKIGALSNDEQITFDLLQGKHRIKAYFRLVGGSGELNLNVLPACKYTVDAWLDLWAKIQFHTEYVEI